MKPCPHKNLRKQLSGQQVWYVCECGQKFKAAPWDGKVKVVTKWSYRLREEKANEG